MTNAHTRITEDGSEAYVISINPHHVLYVEEGKPIPGHGPTSRIIFVNGTEIRVAGGVTAVSTSLRRGAQSMES